MAKNCLIACAETMSDKFDEVSLLQQQLHTHLQYLGLSTDR